MSLNIEDGGLNKWRLNVRDSYAFSEVKNFLTKTEDHERGIVQVKNEYCASRIQLMF